MSKVKVGQVYESLTSGPYTITSVDGCMNISLRFVNTGTTISGMSSSDIIRGKIKDYMLPTVYGVGYLGAKRSKGQNDKHIYNLWINMISRCYSGRPQFSMYDEVTVHPDWHNYTTFAEDIKALNGYEEWLKDTRGYHLDKDLIDDSAKIYSKDTCTFLLAAENVSLGQQKRWAK